MDDISQLKTCRICANTYNSTYEMEFVQLFKPVDGLEREMNFILSEIETWQLNILPNDGLSQHICANCFAKFCSVDAFRQECEEAQQKLLQPFLPEQQCSSSINNAADSQLQFIQDDTMITEEIKSEHYLEAVQQQQSEILHTEYQHIQQFANGEISNAIAYNNGIIPIVNNLPEEGVNYEIKDDINDDSVTQSVFYKQPNISFANEADHIVESKMIETEMEGIVSQDLEDVLKGNIIATKNGFVMLNGTNAILDDDNDHSNDDDVDEQSIIQQGDFEISSDTEMLDQPMNAALAANPFACQYCYCSPIGSIDHLVFPTSEALSQHFFDVHDPNLPYTCPHCVLTYNTSSQRDKHIRTQHLDHCEYCKKKLRYRGDVTQHNCSYVGDWECNVCGEKFIQTPLNRFRTHQRKHVTAKQFCCSVCERVFARRANMEAHQRLHIAQASSMLSCDECNGDKVFSGEYELKRHKYQVHNGELPVKCDYCAKGFVSMAFLTRHVQHFHPEKLDANNANAVTCTNCGISFTSVHKLRFHMQRPRDENGKCISPTACQQRRQQQRQGIYPCHLCSKRFHLKSQQQNHLKTHDATLRPFQCDQCNIRCRTSFQLKQHVNVAHLNLKPFECTLCGKCFGLKRDLREHIQFHSAPSINCPNDGCNYICKNDKALNDHIRHKHRLKTCEYCGAAFTRQRLTTHLRNVHRAEIDVEVAGGSGIPHGIIINNNCSDHIAGNDADISSNQGVINSNEANTNSDHQHSVIQHDSQLQTIEVSQSDAINDEAAAPALIQAIASNAIDVSQFQSNLSAIDADGGQIGHFFMGSIIDPEHEIIIT